MCFTPVLLLYYFHSFDAKNGNDYLHNSAYCYELNTIGGCFNYIFTVWLDNITIVLWPFHYSIIRNTRISVSFLMGNDVLIYIT